MILTPEQQRVYDWLDSKLDLPVFAELYKGALDLLQDRPPGYITFVNHAGRELMNSLAPTYAGVQRRQVDYKQLVDNLQSTWKDEWGGRGVPTHDNPRTEHSIPHDTCQKVKELIDEHKAGRERNNQADVLFFTNFLDYDSHEQIPENFLKEWKRARKWFQGHAHLRSGRFSADVPSKVKGHFRILDGLLYVAASSEFERLRGIDAILEETNR